jgi:hypothetical protein
LTQNVFSLVNYANVVITSFSAPASVSVGSPIAFEVHMQNEGEAATNEISLLLSITGPPSFNSVYQIGALSPGQTSNSTINLDNVTGTAGSYTATVTATYNSLGKSENAIFSPITYTVSVPNNNNNNQPAFSPAVTPLPPPVTPIPLLAFTYMPIMISGQPGAATQSQIGFQNNGSSSEQIKLAIGGNFSKILSLSSTSLSLAPNQSGSVQIFFRPNFELSTGVYSIPILVSARYANGGVANGTQYLTFSIYKQSNNQPTVASQIYLTNSSRLADGVISIIAPRNGSIINSTLVEWLPMSVAANASDINFYGLPTNITVVNGTYKISSYISDLPKNQTIYEYYSIRGPTNTQLLLRSQYALYTLSQTSSSNILRLADISAPTVAANSTGTITVSLLYTGTKAAPVSFYLVPPPSITLQNETQNVTALPNQLIVKEFKILRHPTNGTYIFQLYIKTIGANLTYGIPIVITPTGAIYQPKPQATFLPLYVRVAIFIVLIVAILSVLLRGHIGRRQRYSSERAGHLIRIKEQIKRG